MRTRRSLVAALGMVAALALTACGGGAGPGAAEDEGEPVTGGDATIVLSVDSPRGLDPANLFNLTPSGDANRFSAIYGVLFWSDASTGEVNPGLGQSLEPDDTGATWTLTLKPDLVFSDETPLDAEAVKFNYERIQDPETASPIANLLDGTTFEVVDPTTLSISLAEPNLQFDRILSTSLTHIASPTAIQNDPDFANNPIGAGPFVMSEWVRDDHMTVVRNDLYYEEGKPYLDSITFLVIRDVPQRLSAVQTGQAQAAVTGSEIANLQGALDLGLEVTEAPAGGGPIMMLNTQQAPFNDIRARQAILYAIDRTDYADVVDPSSEAPESLYGPNSDFFPESSPYPEADPAKAQELFDELAAEGKPVSFTVTVVPSGFFSRTGEYLQSRLSEYNNVNVEIEVLDNAALDERVFQNRDYEMALQIVPIADPEPNLAKLLETDGQTNYMGYSNPEMDAALEAARQSTDAGERSEQYAIVESIVAEEVPIIPMRNQIAFTVHAGQLNGLTLHGDGSLLYDRLWLEY